MFLAILADTWEIAFSTAISSVSLPPESKLDFFMCFTSVSVMVKACCFVPYTFHWRRVVDLSGEKLKKYKIPPGIG